MLEKRRDTESDTCRVSEMIRNQSSQFLPVLMDAIPYPVIVRDPDHQVLLANRAAMQVYGDDVLNDTCHHACRGREAPCEDCPGLQAMRTRRPVTREIWDPQRQDYLLISSFPIFNDDDFCGIIETAQVVTESRQNVRRIRELLARVTAQNKKLLEWRSELDFQLDLAREIQKNLLPQHPMCFSELCLDFRYLPCGKVGGDLYDVQIVDDDHIVLMIADASGHGVSAAFVMMMIKVVFEAPYQNPLAPDQMLASMNRQLVNFIPSGQFVTAFYGVYSLTNHTLRYSRGGHPLPLLLRHESDELEGLDAEGFPLGTLDDIDFSVEEVTLNHGDRLLFYTDGVIDARNPEGQRFQQRGLEKLYRETRDKPVIEVLEHVVNGLWDFMDGRRADDDVTLMTAEYTHERFFGLPEPKHSRQSD